MGGAVIVGQHRVLMMLRAELTFSKLSGRTWVQSQPYTVTQMIESLSCLLLICLATFCTHALLGPWVLLASRRLAALDAT